MKVGIGSYSYPWAVGRPGYPRPGDPLSPFDLVDEAAAYDLHLVQIADNLPLVEMEEDGLRRLAQKGRENEISFELGAGDVRPKTLRSYLEVARLLEARLLRAIVGDPGGVKKQLEEVLPDFERADVVLALENHEALSAAELARLLEDMDHPQLGICLDTVNSLGREEPLREVLTQLAPYAVNVHYKDYEIERYPSKLGFRVVGRPAGEGRIPGELLREKVEGNDREVSVILEQWPPFRGTIEWTVRAESRWVKKSVGFLRDLFSEG